jgi:hypothetical protein
MRSAEPSSWPAQMLSLQRYVRSGITMTEHIDIPLDVIEGLITNAMAGKNTEVIGALIAIRDLILDPSVRSIFEINSASLLHHQANRIIELENAAERFAKDVMDNSFSEIGIYTSLFREWMSDSKTRYIELTKDLVKK